MTLLMTIAATYTAWRSGVPEGAPASGAMVSLDPCTGMANPPIMHRVLMGFLVAVLLTGTFVAGFVVGRHADDRRVPSLLGLGTNDGGQAAARRELAAVGLRIGRVTWVTCASDETGLVVTQNPPSGTVVPQGATVNVGIGGPGVGLFSNDPEPCLPGRQHPAGQPAV